MAYTIIRSDGTVLTTVQDGTINTTSTSLGLPGRNFSGYGQSVDTNFVRMVENFAATTVPANPLRGQLWFNTNNQQMYVCPTDGETNFNNWLALTSTGANGDVTFGNVTINGDLDVTGNIVAENITANVLGTFFDVQVSNLATVVNANVTSSLGIGDTLTVDNITTSNPVTQVGSFVGTWNFTSDVNISGGNLTIANTSGEGIVSDNYYYANGDPINFDGSYANSNVIALLADAGYGVDNANVGNLRTDTIIAGNAASVGNTTLGTITGNWILTGGSRLSATYADLAERFEADAVYDAGTVVELGGDKEVTAVKLPLSEDVFGVVANTAAYLMNGMAGDDETHPPIAVSGRVQVKVTGEISKGQRLVSAGDGIARGASASEATPFNVIGRSLEDKSTTAIGFVEAFVTIK